jgi:hypothetical protein
LFIWVDAALIRVPTSVPGGQALKGFGIARPAAAGREVGGRGCQRMAVAAAAGVGQGGQQPWVQVMLAQPHGSRPTASWLTCQAGDQRQDEGGAGGHGCGVGGDWLCSRRLEAQVVKLFDSC